jgi:hypothetical protein
MKSDEEIMEILEAFDLTGSFRSAGDLAGCSHHTVEHYVALRDEGRLAVGESQPRPKLIDAHLPKIEEWVVRSNGKIRADVVADKLAAVGFDGSERTVRRAVATVKSNYRAGRRRVSAVDPGAGDVGAVGLGSGSTHRRAVDQLVLRLVGVVPVAGDHPDVGPHVADVDRLSGSGDAQLRRRSDLLADR